MLEGGLKHLKAVGMEVFFSWDQQQLELNARGRGFMTLDTFGFSLTCGRPENCHFNNEHGQPVDLEVSNVRTNPCSNPNSKRSDLPERGEIETIRTEVVALVLAH